MKEKRLQRRICQACSKGFITDGQAKYCSPNCRSLVRSNPNLKNYKQGYYLAKSGRREKYDSSLEHRHMLALDAKNFDWTKYHGIRIPYWHPRLMRTATYIPDFLVKTSRGYLVQELKPYGLVGDQVVQAKAAAARDWCKRHGYQYDIVTYPGQI